MMHFSTSSEIFRKKLPYSCKVKVLELSTVGVSSVHPLILDEINVVRNKKFENFDH